MRYMLDTNVLVFILRRQYLEKLRDKFNQHQGRFCISSLTVDELQIGVEYCSPGKRPGKQRELDRLLANIPVIPFDEQAAVHSAEIRHYLKSRGQEIGSYDNLIAAHARRLGLTVITNNTKEFSRVPGLLIEDWVIDADTA